VDVEGGVNGARKERVLLEAQELCGVAGG
jgi:hypothetical protein